MTKRSAALLSERRSVIVDLISVSSAIPLDAQYGMLGGAWEEGRGYCLQAVARANLFIAYCKLSLRFHPFKDLKQLDLRITVFKGAIESCCFDC